ncbi:hypothetical protein ACHAWC_011635 [Mediolabrus comicus]
MMAGLPDEVLSTAQVKEEGQNAYQAETDTEGEDEDIDLDNLLPLPPTLASRTKFPIGCKVWYNVGNSKIQPKILRAKAAIVTEVYHYFGTTKYVYKLQSEAPTEHEIILYEHKLVYAIGCPVKVEKSNTKGAMDGTIVAPNVDKGEDGCRVVTYSVQYSGEEEGGLTIEGGVAAERIKYRGKEVEAHSKSEVVRGNKLKEATTTTMEEKEVHDETREDISPRRSNAAETTRTVNMKSDTLSEKQTLSSTATASDSLKQPAQIQMANRWEPPLSSEPRRSSEFEATERPSKFAKIEDDSKVAYEVTVPSWVPKTKSGQKGTLFGHLIGVRGNKTKAIQSETGCNIRILDKQGPMKIVFTSTSVQNVKRAFGMIKQSIVEFLSDENSENRLTYELVTTATGSLCRTLFKQDASSGLLLLKSRDGVKRWSRLFELPCCEEGEGNDCHGSNLDLKFNGHCHGSNPDLKSSGLESSDCRVVVFERSGKVPLASPYIYVSGSKLKEVKSTTSLLVDSMRKHQRLCPCRPKW